MDLLFGNTALHPHLPVFGAGQPAAQEGAAILSGDPAQCPVRNSADTDLMVVVRIAWYLVPFTRDDWHYGTAVNAFTDLPITGDHPPGITAFFTSP